MAEMTAATPVAITANGYDEALPYSLPLPYDGGVSGASMGAG